MIAPAGVWSVDAERSRVEFAIKHMLVSTLRGRFGEFEGTLELGADGAASALGSVAAASIDTNDHIRDQHLRDSADFFDVESHPRINFKSTRIEERRSRSLRICGELTMRGVTRPIVLDGQSHDLEAGSEPRLRLTLKGEVNRRDFGLVWNQTLDSGGALIGNSVKISAEISMLSSTSDGAGRVSPGETLEAPSPRGNARPHRRAAAGG